MTDALLHTPDRKEALSRVYARAVAAGAATLLPTAILTEMALIYRLGLVEKCDQRLICS